MEIRKRENPGHDICVALSQVDQERKKASAFVGALEAYFKR